MTIWDKNGNVKPSKQIAEETRKRNEAKLARARMLEKGTFRMRGFIISDAEWFRLDRSIAKLKQESKHGVQKQIVVNNIFKEFNDKILGNGEGYDE